MIIKHFNDGDTIDAKTKEEFNLNPVRDFNPYIANRTEDIGDINEGSINFVGFVTNKDNDMLVVLPKKYKSTNIKNNAQDIFEVINKHRKNNPDKYIGKLSECKYNSNFPFSSFYKIYDYYQKYGLYIEEKVFTKANSDGKIDWKNTIKKSSKFILNGDIQLYPIYYKKKYYFSTFLTECMIFSIDYTLSKFNVLLHLPSTGKKSDIDFLKSKEKTIRQLLEIRQCTFKDNVLFLIESLIDFYSFINIGGNYFLKHYSFYSVWEDMVMNYLNSTPIGFTDEKIIFDSNPGEILKFEKPIFRPNIANDSDFFQPDYYYSDERVQLILDAKYYKKITGINYKQISYHLFLCEHKNNNKIPAHTYSALILPDETNYSKVHFKMNSTFNSTYENLIIFEEYLDIKQVIHNYLS